MSDVIGSLEDRFSHDAALLYHSRKQRSQSLYYRKVPKFSDAKKLCCNLPKIQTKRPNLKGIFSK